MDFKGFTIPLVYIRREYGIVELPRFRIQQGLISLCDVIESFLTIFTTRILVRM
jgi:hypothetical protein